MTYGKYIVYGLVDPRTDAVRYVGKSMYGAQKRLTQHIGRRKTYHGHSFTYVRHA